MPRTWNIASARVAPAALLVLCAFGCTHDLDAVQKGGAGGTGTGGGGAGGTSSGTGGDSGSGGTSSGGTSSGGSGGTGGDAGPKPEACEPCKALPPGATALGITRCCLGRDNAECGVSFQDGELCLAPKAAGQENPECPDITGPMSITLAGCCRVDGACGGSAMALDLGCIRGEDLPPSFDASGSISCRYECDGDNDCDDMPDFICVEHEGDAEPAKRFCAKQCDTDGDCDGKHVCAITNNDAEDRVDSYCQLPIGSLGPGGVCDDPNDCQHGLCANVGMAPSNTCTELCRVPADCPADRPMCITARIPIPSAKNKTAAELKLLPASSFQQFGICAPE